MLKHPRGRPCIEASVSQPVVIQQTGGTPKQVGDPSHCLSIGGFAGELRILTQANQKLPAGYSDKILYFLIFLYSVSLDISRSRAASALFQSVFFNAPSICSRSTSSIDMTVLPA